MTEIPARSATKGAVASATAAADGFEALVEAAKEIGAGFLCVNGPWFVENIALLICETADGKGMEEEEGELKRRRTSARGRSSSSGRRCRRPASLVRMLQGLEASWAEQAGE